ncbi:MAG: TIGR04372 family glycosyltransferase, partial [Methyloceanibacter sp.]
DFQRAKGFLTNNDFLKAKECLDRSIRDAPDVADFYYLRGHVAAVLNDPDPAIRDLTKAINSGYDYADAHFYLAMALSNVTRNTESIAHYEIALEKEPKWAQAMINLAHLKLWYGAEDAAVDLLRKAIQIEPAFSMPHQNLAARYERASYKPTALDLEGRRELLLYDAYNFAAERALHVGMGNYKGVRLWTRALQIQKEIARDFSLPEEIVAVLKKIPGIDWTRPFRILPYEWVTQIGHIGMLDTYYKIQALGWRPAANLLLLAPKKKVVNRAYLAEWAKYFHIISDEKLVDALFPYQRYIGDCFNAYLLEDGTGVSWPDMGARAHIAWDEQHRPPLLTLSEQHVEKGRAMLESMGMTRNAWFACLHNREGGFHRESIASIQGHRNATITDYLPAVRLIVDHGGWVVRMGDPTMTPLPLMEHVIDYAHSPTRRDWMDIFLCGAARFFIGTTSGLINAVISFRTPCVLVNCVSNFSQLWNEKVLFALKLFWSEREQRYLKLPEITNDPIRSRIFNIRTLNDLGVVPINNSPGEILSTVAELMEELEHPAEASDRRKTSVGVRAWEATMRNNSFFGGGRPSRKFMDQHSSILL